MTEKRLLLVDDDSDLLLSLSRGLKVAGFAGFIDASSSTEKALELIEQKKPQVAVVDLCIENRRGVESGFELLRKITVQDESCRVIVLTGHGSVHNGVRAVQGGAANFLEKPVDPSHLLALIEDGVRQCEIRRAFLALRHEQQEDALEQMIIGSSAAASKLRKELLYAGQNNQSVLIVGETGTGKSLAARAIHQFGKREGNKFLCFQPSIAGADMAASELFGHVRGAFTGAMEDREGLFQQAAGGTLFLDEVDMLPEPIQVLLLRALQEKRYRPIGSSVEQESDIRFLSASNTDVEQAMEDGKLRRDFYHRIAHRVIEIPPLRSRVEDIPELAEAFLSRLRSDEKVQVFSLSDAAISLLANHHWPGNVRELCSTLEGAAYSADFECKSEISAEHVTVFRAQSSGSRGSFREQVERFQVELIQKALHRHAGNQLQAAQSLRVDRSTLRRVLARNEVVV